MIELPKRRAGWAASEVSRQSEQVHLTERDSLRVLEILEKPPTPNARLLAAARDLPHTSTS